MELNKLKLQPDGYNFIVLEDYSYHLDKVIGDGIITVQAGFKTDLASVPRLFWNFIAPYGGHTQAAVIHDWIYSGGDTRFDRKEADLIFLEIMKEQGVGKIKRKIMYYAVRLFGFKSFYK